MIRKWCKQSVIEEIQTMPLSDLNTKTVRKINRSLYNGALTHCTSWRNALEMAGFDYENVKQEREYLYSNGIRSNRRIRRLATAQDLENYSYSEGIKQDTIYKDDIGFFVEDSYKKSATLLHEVKCNNCNHDVLITHQMRAYYKKIYGNINVKGCSKCGHSCRGRGWTQEALLDAIEKLAPLRRTYSFMQEDKTTRFYHAGRKMFGSWDMAVKLCDQRWAGRLNTKCDKVYNKANTLLIAEIIVATYYKFFRENKKYKPNDGISIKFIANSVNEKKNSILGADQDLTPQKTGHIIKKQLNLKSVKVSMGMVLPYSALSERIDDIKQKFGIMTKDGKKAKENETFRVSNKYKETKMGSQVTFSNEQFQKTRLMTWDKPKLLHFINKLKPSQRNWTFLAKDGKLKLYHSASKHFGSWDIALNALPEYQKHLKDFNDDLTSEWEKHLTNSPQSIAEKELQDISILKEIARRANPKGSRKDKYDLDISDLVAKTTTWEYKDDPNTGWTATQCIPVSSPIEEAIINEAFRVSNKITHTKVSETIEQKVEIYDEMAKHVDDRDGRHDLFSRQFNKMAAVMNEYSKSSTLNGRVLSLPGAAADVDLGRMMFHFSGITEFIYFEREARVTRIIKAMTNKWNKILKGYTKFVLHENQDIMESKYTNIALANLDLECTMTEDLMDNCIEIVKNGLIGREYMGLLINTSTRGPRGMTIDDRDRLWHLFLDKLNSTVVYNSERQSYNSGQSGCNMALFAAVITK